MIKPLEALGKWLCRDIFNFQKEVSDLAAEAHQSELQRVKTNCSNHKAELQDTIKGLKTRNQDLEVQLKHALERAKLDAPLPDYREIWEELDDADMTEIHEAVQAIRTSQGRHFNMLMRLINSYRTNAYTDSMRQENLGNSLIVNYHLGGASIADQMIEQINHMAVTPLRIEDNEL